MDKTIYLFVVADSETETIKTEATSSSRDSVRRIAKNTFFDTVYEQADMEIGFDGDSFSLYPSLDENVNTSHGTFITFKPDMWSVVTDNGTSDQIITLGAVLTVDLNNIGEEEADD